MRHEFAAQLQGYLLDDVSDAFDLSRLPINSWAADTYIMDFHAVAAIRQRTGSGRERGSYYLASSDVDAHLTSPQSTWRTI